MSLEEVRAKITKAREFIPAQDWDLGPNVRRGHNIALEYLADALEGLALEVERLSRLR